jgi:hypothetical protein
MQMEKTFVRDEHPTQLKAPGTAWLRDGGDDSMGADGPGAGVAVRERSRSRNAIHRLDDVSSTVSSYADAAAVGGMTESRDPGTSCATATRSAASDLP